MNKDLEATVVLVAIIGIISGIVFLAYFSPKNFGYIVIGLVVCALIATLWLLIRVNL